jgi:hypothetical protein
VSVFIVVNILSLRGAERKPITRCVITDRIGRWFSHPFTVTLYYLGKGYLKLTRFYTFK